MAAVSVRAESLGSLYRLADDPPKFFRRVSEEDRRMLKLYIARVPGGQDLILTTFKPRGSSVTAEDITSCLYYLRVQPSLAAASQSPLSTSHEYDEDRERMPPPPPPKDNYNYQSNTHGAASSSTLSVGSTNRERWSISSPTGGGATLVPTTSARTSRSCSPPKRSQPPLQEFSVTVIRRDVGAGSQQVVGQVMTVSECERRSKIRMVDARQARRDRQQLMLEIWNRGYDKFLPQKIAAAGQRAAQAPRQPPRPQAPGQTQVQTQSFSRNGQPGLIPVNTPPVATASRPFHVPVTVPVSAQELPAPLAPPLPQGLPASLRAGHPQERPLSPPSPPPPPPPHHQRFPQSGTLQMPRESAYIPPRKPLGVQTEVSYTDSDEDSDASSLQSPPFLPPPPPPHLIGIPNPHMMRMDPSQRQNAAAAGSAGDSLYVSKFTEIYSPDTPVDANLLWDQNTLIFRRVLALEGEGFWKVQQSKLAVAIANHKRSKSSADVNDHQLEEETRQAMAQMGISSRPPITTSHSEQPSTQQKGENPVVHRQKGYVFDPPNKPSGRCEFESHAGGRKLKLKFKPAYHAADPYAKRPESMLLSTLSIQSPEVPATRSGSSTPGTGSYGGRPRSRSPSPSRGFGGSHGERFKAKFHDKFHDKIHDKFIKPKFKRQGSWTEQEEIAAGSNLKSKLGSLTVESEGLDMLDLVVVSSMGVFLKKTRDWQDLRSNVWTLK